MLHILAESDPTVKIVIGIVVFLLWVISQVAGAVGSKKKTPPVPQMPSQLPLPRRNPPARGERVQRDASVNRQAPPRPITPAERRAQAKNAARQEKLRRQNEERARALQQMQQRGVSQPPPLRVAPAPEAQDVRSKVVVAATPVPSRAAEGPTRRERLRSILRPRNLQKEFMLTEILQPPVALRNDDRAF
jgi:hypothetical protein